MRLLNKKTVAALALSLFSWLGLFNWPWRWASVKRLPE